MFSCSEVKMVFCFAVRNNVTAFTLNTIKGARAEFFREHIFQMKVDVSLDGDLKRTFNWQYGKVLSVVLCCCFFISNNVLPRNWKIQTVSQISFLVQYKCFDV